MPPDKIYKVQIKIAGLTEAQAKEDMPELLNEIQNRPWLFDARMFWDDSINKLVMVVWYEFEDKLEDGAFDQLLDRVLAKMPFGHQIEFDIKRI